MYSSSTSSSSKKIIVFIRNHHNQTSKGSQEKRPRFVVVFFFHFYIIFRCHHSHHHHQHHQQTKYRENMQKKTWPSYIQMAIFFLAFFSVQPNAKTKQFILDLMSNDVMWCEVIIIIIIIFHHWFGCDYPVPVDWICFVHMFSVSVYGCFVFLFFFWIYFNFHQLIFFRQKKNITIILI